MGFSPHNGNYLDSEGNIRNVISIYDQLVLGTSITSIFRGEVEGITSGYFGSYGTVDTSANLLSNNATIRSLPYPYRTSAQKFKLSSSDNNDNATGTGARNIYISGLDGDYNFTFEYLDLDGQTPVETVNEYIRPLRLQLITVGSNTDAVGDRVPVGTIYLGDGTVTAGVPANVFLTIENYETSSKVGIYTVPAGFTLYASILHFNIQNAGGGNAGYGQFASRIEDDPVWSKGNLNAFADTYNRRDYIFSLVEKTDLQMRAAVASGTGVITGELDFYLIAN